MRPSSTLLQKAWIEVKNSVCTGSERYVSGSDNTSALQASGVHVAVDGKHGEKWILLLSETMVDTVCIS